MRIIMSFAVAVMLVLVVLGRAQEVVKPGPEHEKLKAMVGVWDATIEEKGSTSKATMTYKMGLGDLWLLEDFKGEFGGMKFEGLGSTSFDPKKKKYVGVWIDSMTPFPMISEGDFDKEGRMVMKAEMPGPDGKMMKLTMVSQLKDKNNAVFTMTAPGPDGSDSQVMKISYKRQEKK